MNITINFLFFLHNLRWWGENQRQLLYLFDSIVSRKTRYAVKI